MSYDNVNVQLKECMWIVAKKMMWAMTFHFPTSDI